VDTYLSIAEEVLRVARQPLTPREILKRAYSEDLIPAQLYGKTQHKTLQARLSEDILLRRERSSFFRTEPGVFFLREFIPDETVPQRFRIPIVARRRQRELPQRNALALDRDRVADLCQSSSVISSSRILKLLRNNRFHYAPSTRDRDDCDVLIWSYVLVLRDNYVLTYRHGRYREARDSFLRKRSIGFFTPVVEDDQSLFSPKDHGIVSSGLRGLCIDLDLPYESVQLDSNDTARLECFVCAGKSSSATFDLLALVKYQSPSWFEPVTRRLAINDLRWQDLRTPVNHIEDFDPWSQAILDRTQLAAKLTQAVDGAAS